MHRVRRWLSLGLAAAPVAVGLVRAVQTRRDLRLVAMAVTSLLAAAAITAIAQRMRMPRMFISLGTFIVAVIVAVSTAIGLGATAAPGIWAVATVFGACMAGSCAFAAPW